MDIKAKKAEYETQLARLMASPLYQNIQRLQGAIAALGDLEKAEEGTMPDKATKAGKQKT